MIQRRILIGGIAAATVGMKIASAAEATPPSAAERLNAVGPEMERISKRVGLWDVTETVWAEPGAQPAVTTGLVAERVLMGSLMQEIIRPATDEARRAVARTDLLSFNRVEGVWQYVSFDMRFPVGLMRATGAGDTGDEAIHFDFEPFAVLLPGPTAIGQLRRMKQTIRLKDQDNDVKDQRFIMADGTGVWWLAHRYAYKRRA